MFFFLLSGVAAVWMRLNYRQLLETLVPAGEDSRRRYALLIENKRHLS